MVKLSLVPSRTNSSQPEQYKVDLGFGEHALITRVAHGWHTAVYSTSGAPAVDRGLFGTPQDALAVLQAEVTERVADWAGDRIKTEQRRPMPRA